jgi:hypothetical protein
VDYQDFLHAKSQMGGMSGFEPEFLPDFLFPFQADLTSWAIRKGRAAIWADCGLGKGPMALVWAENVHRHTNRPVLILTPLAVSAQMVREGKKFGIDVTHSRDGKHSGGIVVTNYERIHHFEPSDFEGVVCDEASVLKAFDGKRRKQVTRFLSRMSYRLLCTATAAPNDFIEVGTQSEALGELTQSEMLGIFFKASDNKRHSLFKEGDFWNRAKWFFRPHSEQPFWQWVCSWARACRKPSDLGYDDAQFILPELRTSQHITGSEFIFPGELFPRIACTLKEQRIERKRTMEARCDKVAELVDAHDGHSIAWCQYNPEGDILEKAIPGAVQIAGCDSDEWKEAAVEWFVGERCLCGLSHNGIYKPTSGCKCGVESNKRIMVSKPKCLSFGLNFQHCDHLLFFPSHSYEQTYQAIRRCWRFGQTKPVQVDIVTTEGEAEVMANLQGKQIKADRMFSALVAEMNRGQAIVIPDRHTQLTEIPAWL